MRRREEITVSNLEEITLALRIRNPPLYPPELREQFSFSKPYAISLSPFLSPVGKIVGAFPQRTPVHGPPVAYDRWRDVCTGMSYCEAYPIVKTKKSDN